MKKAFITGITGQDGSYLTEFLLGKNYEVYGMVRRTSSLGRTRLDHLDLTPEARSRFHLVYGDLGDASSLSQPSSCRAGILQQAPLAGSSLAPAKTAIVEDQDGQAMCVVQKPERLNPMRDVAGIAMSKQHHGARAVMRHKPPVQSGSVGRVKPSVFQRQSVRRPITLGIANRMIHLRLLEPRQRRPGLRRCAADQMRQADTSQQDPERQTVHECNRPK